MKAKHIKCILDMLSQAGLMPYLQHNAKTGSVYIKFRKNIGGTLRISNHKQRKKYSYRWNLRSDYDVIHTKTKHMHDCYYYPFSCFEDMICDMISESVKLDEGTAIIKRILAQHEYKRENYGS